MRGCPAPAENLDSRPAFWSFGRIFESLLSMTGSVVALYRAGAGSRAAVLRLRVPWISATHAQFAFEVGLLALLYYGSAKVGFVLHFAGPVAAIVWLPVGVGISYLYLRGLRFWPGVLIGDLLANDYGTIPLAAAFAQTAGNILEVVIAARLLRYLGRRGGMLDRVGGVAWMLVPIAAATTVSATIGLVSLRLAGVVTHSFPVVWRTWWLGDACGALLVVPLAVAWAAPLRAGTRRRYVEAAAMLTATVAVSLVAFNSSHSLVYLTFPALIWAALRFGQRGATLVVLVISAVSVWDTTHRTSGPFHFHSITGTILSTQLFIAVAAVSALSVAAIVSEREKFAEGLGKSRAQLLLVAEAERHRIERNLHDGAQQRLLVLAMNLRFAAEQARETPEVAAGLIEDAEADLQVAFDELRELSQGMHPAVLTDLGLATAIRSAAARSLQPITLVQLPAVRVDPAAEAVAYFVFMEAVANAQKHGAASSIEVRSTVSSNGLAIEVRDNGVGGASEPVDRGLRGIRDRVEYAGGTLTVDSVRGRGTLVSAQIPLPPD